MSNARLQPSAAAAKQAAEDSLMLNAHAILLLKAGVY
jgi:hypothetical protein